MRARALFPVVCLGLGACASAPDEAVDSVEEAIIAGRAVSSARPAVGYLADRSADGPDCTATLIDRTTVLTAAHCVQGRRATARVFGTGVFRTSGATRHDLTRCVSHPQYRDTNAGVTYDVAYCVLAAPITNIKPLALAPSAAFGAKYLALGYGQTDPGDEDSGGPRRQLTVHRVDPEDEPLLEGLEHMLATVSKTGDTCYGDSGGPLLVLGSNGVARVAGVLHGGIGWEDEDECGPGGLSLYAPIGESAAFLGGR